MDMTPDSPVDLAEAASTFAALGSEQRLHVLRTLVRAGPDGLAIGELGERTGITGSTLTHLSAAGLVDQVKDGRRIICIAAAFERVQVMSEFLLKECCADSAKGKGGDHG